MMDVREAIHEGVDWDRYDVVALGAPVIYGTYDKPFLRFVAANRTRLDAKANSFFNVSVVARTPEKATVEGNRYMQKFLELSPWKPKDLKVIAGKVDYPAWRLVRGVHDPADHEVHGRPDGPPCGDRLHGLGRRGGVRPPPADAGVRVVRVSKRPASAADRRPRRADARRSP
jgi:hypothetical protein